MEHDDFHLDYNWAVRFDPPDEEITALRERLQAFNISRAAVDQGQTLAILLKDDAGQLHAGISGWFWGACLEIDYLWVRPDLRGQGIGRRLVEGLEAAAAAHGCLTAILDTYSWQAPEFYIKLGYNVFGTVEGYPDGNKKYFLQKQLLLSTMDS